jgi:hypothetical protein
MPAMAGLAHAAAVMLLMAAIRHSTRLWHGVLHVSCGAVRLPATGAGSSPAMGE